MSKKRKELNWEKEEKEWKKLQEYFNNNINEHVEDDLNSNKYRNQIGYRLQNSIQTFLFTEALCKDTVKNISSRSNNWKKENPFSVPKELLKEPYEDILSEINIFNKEIKRPFDKLSTTYCAIFDYMKEVGSIKGSLISCNFWINSLIAGKDKDIEQGKGLPMETVNGYTDYTTPSDNMILFDLVLESLLEINLITKVLLKRTEAYKNIYFEKMDFDLQEFLKLKNELGSSKDKIKKMLNVYEYIKNPNAKYTQYYPQYEEIIESEQYSDEEEHYIRKILGHKKFTGRESNFMVLVFRNKENENFLKTFSDDDGNKLNINDKEAISFFYSKFYGAFRTYISERNKAKKKLKNTQNVRTSNKKK